MKPKEEHFFLGKIFKLHGYKGEINLYHQNNFELNLSKINYLLIDINKTIIPFFIERIRKKKENILLIKFENINSEKEALEILKKSVFIDKKFIINFLKEKEKDLTNYKVYDINKGYLGTVQMINNQTPQKLIFVKGSEYDFCFPMHENFIKKIKVKEKCITINIPEELLTLN